jgi:hypothetical protein
MSPPSETPAWCTDQGIELHRNGDLSRLVGRLRQVVGTQTSIADIARDCEELLREFVYVRENEFHTGYLEACASYDSAIQAAFKALPPRRWGRLSRPLDCPATPSRATRPRPVAMTARLCDVAAVSHGAPAAILKAAFVDEKPAAAAIVLALLDPDRAASSQQLGGRPRDRLQKIVSIPGCGLAAPRQPTVLPLKAGCGWRMRNEIAKILKRSRGRSFPLRQA